MLNNKLEKLLQQGRLKKARKLIKQICLAEPGNANHWFQSGIINAQLNHLVDAETGFKTALKINSEDTQACYNLAKVHQLQGHLEQAVHGYQQVIQRNPSLSEAYNNLTTIYTQLGQLENAKAICKKLIQIKPDHEKSYFNLATVLKDQEDYQEAIQYYHKAIELNQNHIDAHLNLGVCYAHIEEYLLARKEFEFCLNLDSETLDIHKHLGLVWLNLKDFTKSIAHFLTALKKKPNDADSYYDLGNAYFFNSELKAAENHLSKALQLNNENALYHNTMAMITHEQQHHDKATAHIKKSIELDPDNTLSYLYKGEIEKALGDIKAAEKSYHRAIEANPRSCSSYYQLSNIKKFASADDPDLVKMITLSLDPDLTKHQRIELFFGLGKAHEDIGQYDDAFAMYLQANTMYRKSIEYSPQTHSKTIATIIDVFDKAFFEQRSDCGIDDQSAIFIVGMPRSGSTLVEQIISQNEGIYCAGEIQYLKTAMASITPMQSQYEAYLNAYLLTATDIEQFAHTYLCSIQEYGGNETSHITNKALQNYQLIGMIKLALPNAKIIHCMRDPVDTCLSSFKQLYKAGLSYTYDLKELGIHYREYQKLIEHWRDVLPGFVFDFDYEKLINDPETQTRLLFDYLELPWDDSCLSFYESKRVVHTASVAQVQKPLYKESVKRWKKYEKHLKPLCDELGIS